MEEKDVKGYMKRDDFEALAASVLERVKAPCEKALQDSGLGVGTLLQWSWWGRGRGPRGGARAHAVLWKEPRRTMNASECVARGCALQCAMLSPTFRVRDFEVRGLHPCDSWALVCRLQVAGCWLQVAGCRLHRRRPGQQLPRINLWSPPPLST